jgi:hypothetical protein
VFFVDCRAFHCVEGGVCAIDYPVYATQPNEYLLEQGNESLPSKYGVLGVEMRLFRIGNEKLSFVRIRARVGHGHDSTGIEFKGGTNLVTEWFALGVA